MAIYYSQGSGNWSDLENWNTAANGSGASPASIPAMDDQSFVIQAGHVITFDVEDALSCDGSVSGWTTGIAGITITGAAAGATPGELTLTRASNTSANRIYGLRLKANAQITGTSAAVHARLTAGSETEPIPREARHTILATQMHTTATIPLSYLKVELYGTGPIEPVYVLTEAAGVGERTLKCKGLHASANPEMETEWRQGWQVCIADSATPPAYEFGLLGEQPVGNGVLHLQNPLAAAKAPGSLIVLTQRNVELCTEGGTTGIFMRYGAGARLHTIALYHRGPQMAGQYHMQEGDGYLLEGSTVLSNLRIIYYGGANHVIRDKVAIIACNFGVVSTMRSLMHGDIVICGSTYVIYRSRQALVYENARLTNNAELLRLDAANTSAFLYGSQSGNVAVMGPGLQRVQASEVAWPRAELWPDGYTPAGSDAVTRRYPTPWVV